MKNSKISSWLKQNLGNVDVYDPAMLFAALGIIAQCGVYSLSPNIPIQIHGSDQLCSSFWAVLKNQREVSFHFVSTGFGPAVEWRSGYKLF